MYYRIILRVKVLDWLMKEGLISSSTVDANEKIHLYTRRLLEVEKAFKDELHNKIPNVDEKKYLTDEDCKVILDLMGKVEQQHESAIQGEADRLNKLIIGSAVLPIFKDESVITQVWWFNEEALIPYEDGILIRIGFPFVYYARPKERQYSFFPSLILSDDEGRVEITSTLDKATKAWEIVKDLKASRLGDFITVDAKIGYECS